MIGGSLASFIAVLVYREKEVSINTFENKKTFSKAILGRSYCETCKHKLGPFDLIPVLSYIYLNGRCRYCKNKISVEYFFVELVLGAIFTIDFLYSMYLLPQNGFNISIFYINLILFFIFASIIFYVSYYDIKNYLISDTMVALLSALGLVTMFIPEFLQQSSNMLFSYFSNQYLNIFMYHLLSGILTLILFLAIYILTNRKGIGLGDVYLSFPLSFILGFDLSLVFVYISFISGGLYGLYVLLLRRKKLKDPIFFAPFMGIGFLSSLIFYSYFLSLPIFLILHYYLGV